MLWTIRSPSAVLKSSCQAEEMTLLVHVQASSLYHHQFKVKTGYVFARIKRIITHTCWVRLLWEESWFQNFWSNANRPKSSFEAPTLKTMNEIHDVVTGYKYWSIVKLLMLWVSRVKELVVCGSNIRTTKSSVFDGGRSYPTKLLCHIPRKVCSYSSEIHTTFVATWFHRNTLANKE